MDFLKESKHNKFKKLQSVTPFVEKSITDAIHFFENFLGCSSYKIISKSTLEIRTTNGEINIGSFKTQFSKNNEHIIIDVSNPEEYISPRYWTDILRDKRELMKRYNLKPSKYWTAQKLLRDSQFNSEVVFKILQGDVQWVKEKYDRDKELYLEGKDTEYLPRVYYSPEEPPEEVEKSEEEIYLDVFNKLFNR